MDNNAEFQKANEKVHTVESQWHHKIMADAGFVPQTPSAVGFVRSYLYLHPIYGTEITVTTGYSADTWSDKTNGKGGYWGTLEAHVQNIADGK